MYANGPIRKKISLEKDPILERYEIFSKKQGTAENHQRFLDCLNGPAERCDVGAQRESLVYDNFFLNIHHKAFEGRL